ncbi:YHYH protein [Spirosoma jeollabukense]
MNRLQTITAFSGLTLALCLTIVACNKSDNNVSPTTGTTTGTTSSTATTSTTASVGTGVPDVFKKIYGASQIYVEGDYIVVKSTGLPDHKTPYYKGTQWESTLYVADTRSGFKANTNTISSFSYTFKIPKSPAVAATHKALSAATIGVAINGVPLFNQYQMENQLLTPGAGEYVSFDLYGGHPTPFSEYHYHIEPNYLTATKGSSSLIGFLLDGFPLYGSVENGKTLVSNDLDAYHGHTSATADYPNGIYHYHTTADAPYINGNGYYGTAGTWSK